MSRAIVILSDLPPRMRWGSADWRDDVLRDYHSQEETCFVVDWTQEVVVFLLGGAQRRRSSVVKRYSQAGFLHSRRR